STDREQTIRAAGAGPKKADSPLASPVVPLKRTADDVFLLAALLLLFAPSLGAFVLLALGQRALKRNLHRCGQLFLTLFLALLDLRLRGDGLHAQVNLPLRAVDTDDLDFDFLPLRHHVFRLVDVAVRHFADVHQAGPFGANVHEHAELLDAHNLAGENLAFLDLIPVKRRGLDHRHIEAGILVVHAAHPHGDLLAFFQHIANVVHAAAADLRDVEQGVALLDADVDDGTG